jgi:hypothetical protein
VFPWYLGVVQLVITEARVLVAGDLPMGFLGRWC